MGVPVPTELLAVTVDSKEPSEVGVPEIRPLVEQCNPGGSPVATKEVGLSDAVTWYSNKVLSFPAKSGRLLITGVRESFNIVIVIGADIVSAPSRSVAFAVIT
ncbi:MAG: hypothetical protein EBS69_02710 [Verrucomicrobia bacterium]|nr:hypothetical protein [Verrucomicrobiota bacterium]